MTNLNDNTLKLTRKQLSELFRSNPIAVRAFENLFDLINSLTGLSNTADDTVADTALNIATSALELVLSLQKNSYAPLPYENFINQTEIYIPPVSYGTLANQNFNNVNITGGSIAVTNLTCSPAASVTPANNGNLIFQATSNTSLTFKFKGSDGVVRSASLTLV